MKVASTEEDKIEYKSHIEDIGWMNFQKNGETSGTTGQSKRLEAINIKLEEKGIKYKSYIESQGWEDYKMDGETSGTTGLSKRLEAIQIELYGDISEKYNIYYRVHVQNFGWLDWAKNGEIAGTIGYDYRLEAIEIKLINKNEEIKIENESYHIAQIKYSTHIEDRGWTDYTFDGKTSGEENSNKRIESMKIEIKDIEGSIEYRTFIEGGGFTEYKENGEESGTTGQAKRIEAIQMRLNGKAKEDYNVYYRVYVQKLGWLGWTKNDEMAGINGYNYKIEAIQIKLTDISEEIKDDKESYVSKKLKYNAHIEDIGWKDYNIEDEIIGTTGQSKRLEAYKIETLNDDGIEYRSFIENQGWEDYKKSGEESGTTGQSKKIEAVSIKLTGKLSEKYDIYYRVHCEILGWLGWAKNGENSGTIGYNYRVEALQIKLIDKDKIIETKNAFYNKKITYSTHISNIGWTDYKIDGNKSGITSENRQIEAIKINLLDKTYKGTVEYKSLINGFGWEEKFKKDGEISGTTGKSKKIEAIQIKMSGDVSTYYDICYRVYVQNLGWLGWAQNGEMTGSNGYDKSLEAIEIKIIDKNDVHPERNKQIYYMTKDGYYNIEIDGKYIDSKITNGSNIYLDEKSDLKNQIWKIKDYNDGTFRIYSGVNPKLVLTASDKLTLKKTNGKDNELFKIKDLGTGYYEIKSNKDININTFLDTDNNFKLVKFEGTKTYKGIDISKWQGNINWEELIKENPEFIIMRVGTGKNNLEKDTKFDEYYLKANNYDIPVGVYTYSAALNIKDALNEAEMTLKWLDGKNLDLPVFYDIENINQTILGKDVLTKIATTFCDKIKENGYKCGIYANKYFLADHLDTKELSNYIIWLAHWTGANDYITVEKEKYKTDYNLSKYNYWQFSSLGVYKGITENTVDLDLGYDIFD